METHFSDCPPQIIETKNRTKHKTEGQSPSGSCYFRWKRALKLGKLRLSQEELQPGWREGSRGDEEGPAEHLSSLLLQEEHTSLAWPLSSPEHRRHGLSELMILRTRILWVFLLFNHIKHSPTSLCNCRSHRPTNILL